MRIVTSETVASFVRDGVLVLEPGWTLAPSALEWVRRNRVRLAGDAAEGAAAAAAERLAVITVEGIDKPGIIAAVAAEVAAQGANITDLSQTILAGVFVMVMVVELRGPDGYDALSAGLATVGERIGVEVSVRLYSVFEAMHRI